MIAIWIGLIVALVVVEAISTQLVGIWFAIAALISLILAMLGVDVWVQVVVFIVVATLLLIFTRPLAKRLLSRPPEHTNADRVVGQPAVVTEEIDNVAAKGQAKVMGQLWSARSLNGDVIPAGASVTVTALDGVKVIVEKRELES